MIINCKAEIQRITYTNGKSQGMTTIATYDGYWTALSENSNLLEPGNFGKSFVLKIQKVVDIRDSDQVVIEGETYSVQGTTQRKGGSLELTTALLLLNQEDAN